nr:HAMP domain-containing histidine kinase [Bacteroidota bacterium]
MSGKRLITYIIISTIAILGLLWAQFHWISYSYELRTDEFSNKVSEITKATITEVEKSYYCVDFFSNSDINIGDHIDLLINRDSNKVDTVEFFFWNKYGSDSIYGYKGIGFSYPAILQAELHVQYILDKSAESVEHVDYKTINSYRNSITDTEDFINTFDTLLKKRFIENNILIEYEYAITESVKDSIIYQYPKNKEFSISESDLSMTIFKDNYFFNPYELYLTFPKKSSFILSNLWIMILSSSAFVLILIIFLVIFIRTILNQKRLAEMKSDFINNMSHEFRTPVSNINLALDTIEKQRTDRGVTPETAIMSIIREESNRLQDNVDIILNTSFMEDEKLNFNKESINIHELIEKTIKTFELDFINKKGIIKSGLNANKFIVKVDEAHFTNVIYNLIDNAIKYSKNSPE